MNDPNFKVPDKMGEAGLPAILAALAYEGRLIA